MDEGYIKFSLDLQDGPVPSLEKYPGLSEWRTVLYDAGLLGAYHNRVGFGNVSARCCPGDEFVISGSCSGAYRILTPRRWSRVLSVSFTENRLVCRGKTAASSESMSHAAVYRGHSGVRYVAHIHSLPLFRGLLAVGVPATPIDAAFGTPEMALSIKKIVAELGMPSGIIVMIGHEEGIIVYGTSILDILIRIKRAAEDRALIIPVLDRAVGRLLPDHRFFL